MAIAERKLDGKWLIALDVDNIGKESNWQKEIQSQAVEAVFPGLIQDNFPDYHWGVAWYWHKFNVDEIPEDSDGILKIGGAEYIAEYWLNGQYLGRMDSRQAYYLLDCGTAICKGENLLAIRIAIPGREESIDGYTFNETSFWHGNLETNSAGGIFQPVYLAFRSKVRTQYGAVKANPHTGDVSIDVILHNGHNETENLVMNAQILGDSGEVVAKDKLSLAVNQGDVSLHFEMNVASPRLWDMEDPYVYTLNISLIQDGDVIHQYKVNFGFREFLVRDGWFFLNGKRKFFKTIYNREGFHPRGGFLSNDIIYKELTQIKSMNFDSIRFHNYVPAPEVLDMCDRMGILVIQAHGASWGLKESNKYMEEQFRFHLKNVIENTINHPSVVAWELQNECHGPLEGKVARESLPFLRELDDTRLVFLSSGRWDPAVLSTGSISNPGSLNWDCEWGLEGDVSAEQMEEFYEGLGVWDEEDNLMGGPERGDVHLYPRIPLSERGKSAIRECGKDTKPCFLSECGSAAMGEMYDMLRKFEELNFPTNSERAKGCVNCAEYFTAEWNKYGLGEVYPFENDLLLAGDKLNAYTRTVVMECVRSNPKLAGVCVSCLSGPFSGFGMLDWFGQRKQYIGEAMGQCLAPLRWCVFTDTDNIYQNKPFTVEAVLASEDVLKEGTYPIRARIQSVETGCIWDYETEFTVEKGKDGYLPLAIPVFKETICLDAPEGDYNLSITLDKGGVATGGRKTLHISKAEDGTGKKVSLMGVEESVAGWLKSHGVEVQADAKTVLVGDMPDDDKVWSDLYEKVEAGATAVFLKPEAFLNHIDNYRSVRDNMEPVRLPLSQKGSLHFTVNWAWRVHTVLKKHRYTEGLPAGLMHDAVFGQTIPQFIYEKIQVPDEVVAVSLGAPFANGSTYEYNNCFSGVALGVYHYGQGNLVLNTFPVLNRIGKDPAAGKLLINFID